MTIPRAGLILALLAVLPAVSRAATQRRYALVMGVNEGGRGEPTLVYAEDDAIRVSSVLTHLAGVAAEDMVLMRGGDEAGLRRALDSLKLRLTAERTARRGVRQLVFLYYSGHAGAGGLHLGGTELSFPDLKRYVEALGASVAIVIVDACQSGGLTRLKGGLRAKPFQFTVDDQLASRGVAVLASSASGEDAQESERLRGGVFTHHLIQGLLGAADTTRDGDVTLSEAWRYAHAQTVRTTSQTRFVQHPSYSFRLRGQREIVVTRLKSVAGLSKLVLVRPGTYVIFEAGGSGRVVAEVAAVAGTTLRLPAGTYRVRRRGSRAVHEGLFRLETGRSARAEPLTELPYAQIVRKGLARARHVVVSLQAAGAVGGPLLEGMTPMGLAILGLQLDFAPLALQLRVRYGRSHGDNSTLSLVQDQLGVDAGLVKVFDIPRTKLGIGIGLRLGGDMVWQRFTTRGSAPARSQWVWRFGPLVRLELPVHPRVGLFLDGGADVHFVDRLDPASGRAAVEVRAVPFGVLGLTFWLP